MKNEQTHLCFKTFCGILLVHLAICSLHASNKLSKINLKSYNAYTQVSNLDTNYPLATHRELHLSLFARRFLLFDSIFFLFDFLLFAAFCAE